MKKAKDDILIMAPGPINRGVEITGDVADGAQSVILEQVTNDDPPSLRKLQPTASRDLETICLRCMEKET